MLVSLKHPFHSFRPGRLSRRSMLRSLSLVFILLSMAGFSQSLWIFAKAQVAQVLLERAFSETVRTGHPVKAWGWADSWPVGLLNFKRLNKRAIVLKGGSGEALAFGPALLESGVAIGEEGTVVIAAHRDTHFTMLGDVKIGDLITLIRDDGVTFTYRVTSTAVVRWNHSGIVAQASGKNLVLATCYPFDALTSGPERFIVRAEMVS